jgi:myosin heavy subunit
LKILAELLGITKPEELELEIVMKGRIEGIGRTPDKPQNVSSSKESLAKALFDNMFNWLV